MSKIILFCLFIFLLIQSLNAQTFHSGKADRLVKGSNLVRLDPKTRMVRFIQLRDDSKGEEKDQKIWLEKALTIHKNHGL